MAAMDGRFSVSLDDVRKVAIPVLRHRLATNFQAQAEGQTTDSLIKRLLDRDPRAGHPQVRQGVSRPNRPDLPRLDPMATGPDDPPARPGRPRPALSAEEFAEAVYDEPWKYERVDGRLVVMFPDQRGPSTTRRTPGRTGSTSISVAHPGIVEIGRRPRPGSRSPTARSIGSAISASSSERPTARRARRDPGSRPRDDVRDRQPRGEGPTSGLCREAGRVSRASASANMS